MACAVRRQGEIALLDLDGRLMAGESLDQLRAAISRELTNGAREFILNLAKVTMVDSSGIGGLIRNQSAVKAAGGRMKLVGTRENVRHSLKVTRLDRLFEFFDDEAAALAAIGSAK